MSSWGSWSKISKLQQVGDVSFFRSKSSLFIFTTTWESFFCECKENGANEPVYLQCPFGVQRLSIYTTRPEGPSLRMGWDGMDGMDGISKVSFKFLYTLWVYRTCIYLLIYILKNCNQDPYGFKNLISSWGSWSKISKLQQVGDVIDFRSKSSLFIFTITSSQE